VSHDVDPAVAEPQIICSMGLIASAERNGHVA
jgi:hypothetical protein